MIKEKFKNIYNFLGKKIFYMALLSIFIGILIFSVESIFIYVMQGFFLAIGFTMEETIKLPAWYPREITSAFMILVIFGLTKTLVYIGNIFLNNLVTYRFYSDKRNLILNYVFDNFQQIEVPKIMSYFTEEIVRTGTAISAAISSVSHFIITMSFLFLGLKLVPFEMMLSLLLMLVLLLPLRLLNRRISNASYELSKEWEFISKSILRNVNFFIYLKVYGVLEEEKEKGHQYIERHYQHLKNYSLFSSINGTVPNFIGTLIISVCSYFSLTKWNRNPGDIVSYVYIFMRFAQGISSLLSSTTSFLFQKSSLAIIYNFWKNSLRDHERISKISKNKVNTKEDFNFSLLEIRDVYFQYPKAEKYVLEKLNLKLQKANWLVVKGESGSGKSTFLNLILGLNTPSKGDILLNGFNINQKRESLYSKIGYVGPESYLNVGTIRENLLFGLKDKDKDRISEAEINRALQICCLNDLIEKLEDGLETFLFEKPRISSGQQQRLCIARAILRYPEILLLDECTSNLDKVTETHILKNIKEFMPEITVVAITHRDAFDIHGDQFLSFGTHM